MLKFYVTIVVQDHHFSPLSSLRGLQSRLNDLCYLHSTLKCPITLSDHEKVILYNVHVGDNVIFMIDDPFHIFVDRNPMKLSYFASWMK